MKKILYGILSAAGILSASEVADISRSRAATLLEEGNVAVNGTVAKKNAKLNHMENVEFFVGKAEEVLPKKYEKEGIYADVIVVDPPRKGCDETLLSCMVQMAPKRIVYVSCDPATLARDLNYLEAHGYKVKKVQCVDQFCHSTHVETVCLLSRKAQ